MDNDEALRFLEQNQPLPPDEMLGERIEVFDEVRRFFKDNYDIRSIPLLLNAFGDGDGFGVYQLVEDTIIQYPSNLVIPHLCHALQSQHRSVRYWNAQIAALFPDTELVPYLLALFSEDSDMRYAAATALSMIKTPNVASLLQRQLEREVDEGIRELIIDRLDED